VDDIELLQRNIIVQCTQFDCSDNIILQNSIANTLKPIDKPPNKKAAEHRAIEKVTSFFGEENNIRQVTRKRDWRMFLNIGT
jgi:hypothetical protein